MAKKKKKYSVKKILIALGVLFGILALVFFILNQSKKGLAENKVLIKELTKAENAALRRYPNQYHLEVGLIKGLKDPLESKDDYKKNAHKFVGRNKLVEITDNSYYEIPHLTNSLPYLQPQAKQFLNLLGKRFQNRLDELGMREYRYSVASVLRTVEDQKSLRKSNVNATPNNSSHYYGRTFDIPQTRFFEKGQSKPVYSYRLRNLLLRELIKLQDEGKCYVLLEAQTKCIHVTVR